MRARAAALAFAAAAVLGTACSGASPTERTIDFADVDGTVALVPARITVNKGDEVELTVGNLTSRTHGITIVGYGVQEEVNTGNPVDVSFVADKSGTYRIFDHLHEDHRIATLIVQ